MHLGKEKFEILIDLAVMAIQDGYYREAVLNLASALEKFYEFYCGVISNDQEIDADMFKKAWSAVSAQSERQLGMYVMAYLLAMKRPVRLLADSSVRFRNRIVHKGYIPDLIESKKFGDEVLDLIFDVLGDLNDSRPEAVDRFKRTSFAGGENARKLDRYVFRFTSIINLHNPPGESPERVSFSDAVSKYKDLRKLHFGEKVDS
jgi:hypothetical protein